MAVGEECHRPAIFLAEEAQPTEMNGRVSQSLDVLFTRFAEQLRIIIGRDKRLEVGIEVAERRAESNTNPDVLPFVVLLGMGQDARCDPRLGGLRNALSTGMRTVYPHICTAVTRSTRTMIPRRCEARKLDRHWACDIVGAASADATHDGSSADQERGRC